MIYEWPESPAGKFRTTPGPATQRIKTTFMGLLTLATEVKSDLESISSMKFTTRERGFTLLEMAWALVVIAGLSAIYFFFLDSYQERSMSEQAAKVLMLAARTQEEFQAKEYRYFDVEVSGIGGDTYITTPDGSKTSVRVPANVVVSIKTRGKGFTGQAYYTGSKVMHRYDSESGRMTTVPRGQTEAG
jgi:prepilin-type N-terminal cleavage/methylation domain-containing protein